MGVHGQEPTGHLSSPSSDHRDEDRRISSTGPRSKNIRHYDVLLVM
jgi:hypothetical protein